jgi:probable rRNA maturation factor
MIHIQIDDAYTGQIDPAVIERAAQAALSYKKVAANTELSVVVGGDESLRELNNQFLGIDAPTDVLSFPAEELDPDSGNPYIGDILVSLPRAQAQAEAAGHPLEAEVQLLVVHGTLHLLGMDHAEPEGKQEMWQQQMDILAQLGARLSRWPE